MTKQAPHIVYLSVRQMAARYGVHPATIWRWTQTGRVPRPVRLTSQTTRWVKDQVEQCDAQHLQEMEVAS
jgi:predicted DNA-binding transcriptional regulator AlpA